MLTSHCIRTHCLIFTIATTLIFGTTLFIFTFCFWSGCAQGRWTTSKHKVFFSHLSTVVDRWYQVSLRIHISVCILRRVQNDISLKATSDDTIMKQLINQFPSHVTKTDDIHRSNAHSTLIQYLQEFGIVYYCGKSYCDYGNIFPRNAFYL